MTEVIFLIIKVLYCIVLIYFSLVSEFMNQLEKTFHIKK